ncbi:hypothetical protein R3P38DRAFT_2961403 [Favolaschia claudopus]|uniref:DUF6534 domain-containing protein n=1 Tax=Favolaschia claudopus TaxID=2862362 RepID=A0AAW0BCJ5_9AGAR
MMQAEGWGRALSSSSFAPPTLPMTTTTTSTPIGYGQILPALTKDDPQFGLIYYVLGGWLIGSSAVLFLEGIVVTQVYNYVSWFAQESLRIDIAVAILFVLTVLKTIQSFAIVWINNIIYMRDPLGTVALNKLWYQIVNIPLGALIAGYAQLYYVYRLYKLSSRWWLTIPLIILILLGFAAAAVTASVIARSGRSSHWFAVHLSCTFATDTLITFLTLYYLLSARQHALSRTRKLIGTLIRICFHTGVPVSIASLLMLICSQIGGPALKPQLTNSVILVLLDVVPIIYANCMLYILNTRRKLRRKDLRGHPSSLDRPSEITPPSGSQMRWGRPTTLELTVLSGSESMSASASGGMVITGTGTGTRTGLESRTTNDDDTSAMHSDMHSETKKHASRDSIGI